jgi:hypothetical protein
METKIQDHFVMPDGVTEIDIHDYARGQAHGVATLDENGKLVQDFAVEYAVDLPSPTGSGSLVDYVLSFI